MPKQIVVLVAALLSSAVLCFGQEHCPEGFRYVGTLSGSGSYANDFNEVVEVRLPPNATFDKSYQQTNFIATNGQSGAKSNLTAKDVPPSIYLAAYGTDDNEKGWAVSEPQLRVVKRPDGTTDYLFGMRLFCNETVGESHIYGTCSVGVTVCYKPRVATP